MKERKVRIGLGIAATAVLAMAIITGSFCFSDFEYRFMTARFNRTLHEKEKIMEECLLGMEPLLASGSDHHSASESNFYALAEENNITILEYIDSKLIYYSDNSFEVPSVLDDTLFTKPLIFMQNGWFVPRTLKAGNEYIVGLMRIRTDYGFENDIVDNGFAGEFRVPDNVGFSTGQDASPYQIRNYRGDFLFSLLFPGNTVTTDFIFIPLSLWVLFFILLLILTAAAARQLAGRMKPAVMLSIVFVFFAAICAFMFITEKPAVFFRTELFSPFVYSMNSLIPSLGHLMVISILAALFSYLFSVYMPLKTLKAGTASKESLSLYLLMIPAALLFLLYNKIFVHLVYNSNINFETYKVQTLDSYSIAGYFTLILLFLVPFFYLFRVFRDYRNLDAKVFIGSVILTSLIFAVSGYSGLLQLMPLFLLFLFTSLVIWFSTARKTSFFNLTIFLSLVFALYSLVMITFLSEKKTTEKIKIQALIYSTENDPEAEHLLLDIWDDITADTVLKSMMEVSYFEKSDFDAISDYLHRGYFNGYWANYNLNIVLCRDDDSLRVDSKPVEYEECFGFFSNRILNDGQRITGTDFYFIENRQGRTNYLGSLYYDGGDDVINGLFIDLYSDIDVFQPGYPELLIDRKYHGYSRLKDYSFAKYVNGAMVLVTGDFPYDKTDGTYIGKSTDYRLFRSEGFTHVLYRNGNITTVISRKTVTAGDLVISFAYLFIFIFLVSSLILVIVRPPVIKSPFWFNFRQKLQLAFVGIILFSFSVIGIVIAGQAVRQFRDKHLENIKEKLNSVYIELENRMPDGNIPGTGRNEGGLSQLDALLVELSNTFNTDINLYSPEGNLLATSRPEVFFRNLISRRMNILATNNLIYLTRSEYIHREKIGNLEYISAYVPFYNNSGELVAYLNLPYFRMQSILARDISNIIVAVINFMLILIVITTSLAVIISGRLTSPLMMLTGGLASVELGKKSEHLSYSGNDEVGELVKQYNLMVDELEESARKLADSEREYAWREMAKQIAHEIKNPLTPMKLNVQQLLKSWKDGVPGFEKKLERFTRNQIEYIDNLSSIASAFSSFAKMPGSKPVDVDLTEQIKTTLELFKNSDNITFRMSCPHGCRIFIHADREHLNGVFSNLIKNAIQAIPPGKEGVIRVSLEVRGDRVLVAVSDNGSGIPESLKNKMFTPNFTTKSSGTGLGLSIVKRYVESAGGRIWFESEAGNGSTFFVEYPLLYTAENSQGAT